MDYGAEDFNELISELGCLIDEIAQDNTKPKKEAGTAPLQLTQVGTRILTTRQMKELGDHLAKTQGPKGIYLTMWSFSRKP